MVNITIQEINDMVTHWLNTPVNSFLGSSYGNNAEDLLQNPLHNGNADSFIKKLKTDIPVLKSIPQENINIFMQDNGVDKADIILEIYGLTFNIK